MHTFQVASLAEFDALEGLSRVPYPPCLGVLSLKGALISSWLLFTFEIGKISWSK